MFLWEWFGVLSTRLVEFEVVAPEKMMVDGVEKERITKYKPEV